MITVKEYVESLDDCTKVEIINDFLEYKSAEDRELRLEYLLDSKFEAKLALYSNRNDPMYPEEYVEYKNWLNTLS